MLENKDLLLDSLWQLEYAVGQLESDIDFIHCIEENYFTNEKSTGEQWLRWQISSILPTLRKSLESTQMNMKRSIEAIYEDKQKRQKNR